MAALEGIEREKKCEPLDLEKIDTCKVKALNGFRFISAETKIACPIPENLTEEVVFNKDEAELPPTIKEKDAAQP